MSDERLNLTEYDFTVQDEGSIFVLHPCNDAARSWIDEHLYGQPGEPPTWWGGGVVIEHRMIVDVLEGIVADDLTWH